MPFLPPPEDAGDVELSLWCLYELHHRGFDDVADELELDPQVIALRRRLEEDLEQRLREQAPGTSTAAQPQSRHDSSCGTSRSTRSRSPTTPRGRSRACPIP